MRFQYECLFADFWFNGEIVKAIVNSQGEL